MSESKPTEEIDDGGPLFSLAATTYMCEGLSVRDYFAALAMQGLASTTKEYEWEDETLSSIVIDSVAMASYKLADAMLKARAEK